MRCASRLHSQEQAIQYNDTRWLNVNLVFFLFIKYLQKKGKVNEEKDSIGAKDYGGYGDKRSPVN